MSTWLQSKRNQRRKTAKILDFARYAAIVTFLSNNILMNFKTGKLLEKAFFGSLVDTKFGR